MQHEPLTFLSVIAVPHKRMPEMAEMDADLVPPSSFDFNLKQGALFSRLQNPIVCKRGFGNTVTVVPVAVPSNSKINRAAPFDLPFDDSII